MDLHLFFKVLNFGLFVGLLAFFLRRPAKEFWRDRAEGLRVRISQALQRRTKAEAQYKQLMGRLNRMAQEMRELKASIRKEAELEKEKILSQAQDYATKLEVATERIGRQELQKARERLRVLTARLAVELAEHLITEHITAADQGRLTQDYLDRLRTQDFAPLEGGWA